MDNVLSYLQPVDDRAVSENFRGLIRAAVIVALLKSGFAQFFFGCAADAGRCYGSSDCAAAEAADPLSPTTPSR